MRLEICRNGSTVEQAPSQISVMIAHWDRWFVHSLGRVGLIPTFGSSKRQVGGPIPSSGTSFIHSISTVDCVSKKEVRFFFRLSSTQGRARCRVYTMYELPVRAVIRYQYYPIGKLVVLWYKIISQSVPARKFGNHS